MVVEKVLLTSSWEVPPNQWGSRAATVAAHQPVEHFRNFLQKLFNDHTCHPLHKEEKPNRLKADLLEIKSQ